VVTFFPALGDDPSVTARSQPGRPAYAATVSWLDYRGWCARVLILVVFVLAVIGLVLWSRYREQRRRGGQSSLT
jgi:hypothetical protein